MTESEYKILFEAGIDRSRFIRRPTTAFATSSIIGWPRDYDWRLSPDALPLLGCGGSAWRTVGLEDFRLETLALAEHASYLIRKYWRSQFLSFPSAGFSGAFQMAVLLSIKILCR